MKQSPAILFALPCMLLICLGQARAFECNVCHSKNPAMVRMHQATQAKGIGCFDCHKVGERLMGKAQPKNWDSLLKQRVAEPLCGRCHAGETGGRPAKS